MICLTLAARLLSDASLNKLSVLTRGSIQNTLHVQILKFGDITPNYYQSRGLKMILFNHPNPSRPL